MFVDLKCQNNEIRNILSVKSQLINDLFMHLIAQRMKRSNDMAQNKNESNGIFQYFYILQMHIHVYCISKK